MRWYEIAKLSEYNELGCGWFGVLYHHLCRVAELKCQPLFFRALTKAPMGCLWSASASCSNPSCAIATEKSFREGRQDPRQLERQGPAQEEIPFVVARIVLQDFTGVPLLVDLAAMRSAVAIGKDPKMIEPLVPVDLVVDHSVQVDFFGSAEALRAEPRNRIHGAIANATNSSNGASRRSRLSASFRRASASCTR